MKKLGASLCAFLLCACLAGNAQAVVFRAVASDVNGQHSAGSIRFGHASENREQAWSTMATTYAAVAAVPWSSSQHDSIYLTTTPYWAFYLDVWTSGWTYGDVVLRIWAEDASWPGQGWWRVDLQNQPGAGGGFVVTGPGSASSPQYKATLPPGSMGRVLLMQNPEPSTFVALLTGVAGLAAIRVRRRVRP